MLPTEYISSQSIICMESNTLIYDMYNQICTVKSKRIAYRIAYGLMEHNWTNAHSESRTS